MPLQVDFDPSCADAAALRRKHTSQRAFLMNDVAGPSRLRDIVIHRQENDLIDHKVGCARCGPYRPPCGSCGRAATAGHTFFCPQNTHRWRKLFGLRAPKEAAPAPQLRRAPSAGPPGRAARGPDAPLATESGRYDRLTTKVAGPAKKPESAPPSAPAARPAPQPGPRPAPPAAKPAAGARAQAPQAPPKKPAAPAYDPLVVLGLEPGVPWEEIKSAYRQKALQYHPDKVATLAPEFRDIAEKRMREINRAYEALEKKQKASASRLAG